MKKKRKCNMIVIDGCDGVGKETQAILLKKKLESLGAPVLLLSFPNYQSNSSEMVKSYLKGDLTIKEPIHKTCIYAIDRALTVSQPEVVEYLNNPDAFIICDRYTSSSMLFDTVDNSDSELQNSIIKIESLEFNILDIPKPDLNILLHLDYCFIEEVLKERETSDIYESNKTFMCKVSDNILRFNQFPEFKILRCGEEGKARLTEQEVHEGIMRILTSKKRNV